MSQNEQNCPTCGYDRPTFTSDEGTSGFVPQPDAVQADEVKPEWMGRLEPIEWFRTLRSELCCRQCEQKALVHSRELYESAHKRIAELEHEYKCCRMDLKMERDQIQEMDKEIAEQQAKIDQMEAAPDWNEVSRRNKEIISLKAKIDELEERLNRPVLLSDWQEQQKQLEESRLQIQAQKKVIDIFKSTLEHISTCKSNHDIYISKLRNLGMGEI